MQDDQTAEPIDPNAPTEPAIPLEERPRPVGEQLVRLLLVFGEMSGKHPPISR